MTVVVLSDTHRESGTGLAGAARDAVDAADTVVHAGDFTTAAVLDAFRSRVPRLHAVSGNRDGPQVRDRLPTARTLSLGDVTVALTHRRRGGDTGLALFGRERDADLVISGHTHRPSVDGERPVLLNPGSHAAPRGAPATFAVLRRTQSGLDGELRTVGGETVDAVSVTAPTGEDGGA